MPGTSLTKNAFKEIKEIYRLSNLYNGTNGAHAEKLLDLAEKHVKEIRALYSSGDDHFDVETGDLLILCLELLIERGASPDKIMEICYKRYKKKLKWLLQGWPGEKGEALMAGNKITPRSKDIPRVLRQKRERLGIGNARVTGGKKVGIKKKK